LRQRLRLRHRFCLRHWLRHRLRLRLGTVGQCLGECLLLPLRLLRSRAVQAADARTAGALLHLLERLHLDLLLLQLRVVLPRRLCVVAEYELLLNLHFRRLRTKQRSRTSRSPWAKSRGSVLTTDCGLSVCACCWGTAVPAVMP